MDDLIAWAREQLNADEQMAREASRHDLVEGWTEAGEHWHWVEPDGDQVLNLDPVTDEYLNDGGDAALRSVEQYSDPADGWTLPHFVVSYAQEVRTIDAMHIARWDPARVLALTGALRGILDEFSWEGRELSIVRTLVEALYGDRPGYCEEWRP